MGGGVNEDSLGPVGRSVGLNVETEGENWGVCVFRYLAEILKDVVTLK